MIRLLSGDTPRSRTLTVLLLLLLLALVCTPFLIPGARALNMAAKICIFVVLVASYDLLLGYTGIVSFAHTMFFGIGGYGVAIAMTRFEPGWGALLAGIVGALAVSMLLALLIGLFSLRVRAIFFAMITLAVATAFATLVSQLSAWTGGEDGLSFKVPALLTPGFALEDADGEVREWLGVPLNGKLFSYYLVLAGAAVLFLLLLRVVNSPFGRVLQAIRENDFRAEAIGYRTVVYRTVSTVLSAAFATLAGVLMAIWLRYNGPDTSLSFEIMVDILLIVVIGGMGTMYGAVIGTVLFLLAQTYLQDVMKLASEATAALPLLSSLLHPDRWLLWLGLLFVLSVYYFPQGIVGRLRALR
ncbi:branched-chain amino acid ABC transporter permease [Cupriavidus gilardii]|nr:branched-chain amino acid ABC transporter permease [Cupriavidus gilardii]